MKEVGELKWDDLEIDSLNDEDEFVVNFISEIVKRRIELGFSQRKLAEITGVKQSAIARFEKFGAVPQLDTIYKLTSKLNLRIELVKE